MCHLRWHARDKTTLYYGPRVYFCVHARGETTWRKRDEVEEEEIKKAVGQQRRNTRPLRWRAALVIRPANNNHSGRSPLVRVSAWLFLFLSLFFLLFPPLTDLRSGRCIATRIDLSLHPVGHEEDSSATSTIGRRTEGMPKTERERNWRAREKGEGTQHGAEGAREKPRDIRDDRCDEGER